MKDCSFVSLPLQTHLNYIRAIVNMREGDLDHGFKSILNEYDYTGGEIFYHDVNSLYRTAELLIDDSKNFYDFDIPRKQDLGTFDELLYLYEFAINHFNAALSKIDVDELTKEILSPLNNKLVKLENWLATSVMHTLHHVGQAIRISGNLNRQLNNKKVERTDANSYNVLYE